MNFRLLLLIPGTLCPVLLQLVQRKKKFKQGLLLKTIASLSFVLITALSVPKCTLHAFALWILAAHCFDLLGDVILDIDHLLPENYRMPCFLIGGTAFLIGHLCFISALFPTICAGFSPKQLPAVLFPLAVVLLLQLFIKAKPYFRVLSGIYLATLSTAVALSFIILITVTAAEPFSIGRLVFFLGILMFLASDLVLVYNMCLEKRKQRLGDLLIALYYGGQLLIAISVGLI